MYIDYRYISNSCAVAAPQRTTRLPSLYCARYITSSHQRYATEPAPAPTPTSTSQPGNVASPTEWRTIYQLPLIRIVSAFNRLKVYQAALTAAGTPLAYALGEAGQISTQSATICAAIGVSGLLTLTLGSYVAQNLVGFIYVNEQQDHLKLAYVDFWGRRRETLIAIEDLLPDWEQQRWKRSSFYQSICVHSDDQRRYKLLQRFGVVSDPELFSGLFGE